ncbi:MAG: OmpA family protein [Bacteroidota bacterium]|jgi:outer membrane protein OmpA-like peptidoglycan-associated protein|nr:OmpA family protein [Bacteroidota bacterium]
MKNLRIVFVLLFSVLIMASCGKWSNTAKGGAGGAAAGGAVGAAIGKASGNTAAGAIFGAAIGGVAGATIGAYMDKQAEEMERDLENAKIERVGEGIKITFDSGILFDINSSELKPAAKENINNLAEILKKYDDTDILIEGHTDITGPEDYNQTLSEQRSKSVSDYAKNIGVDDGRITTVGYGPNQPIADNDTEAGKRENRRVEVAIYANKQLQRAAKSGDLEVEN